MAYRLPYLFALVAALAGCSTDGPARQASAHSPAAPEVPSKPVRIPLGAPVLIDSSDYVMYPLALGETEIAEESGSYKTYRQTPTHWNMLFYNPKTNQRHLLGSQKMLIHSYTGQESSSMVSVSDEGGTQVHADKLLYFSITTTDFNHDGQLTTDDPTYLFVSDKSGEHFRQLSPDSLHVEGWEIQKSTGKMLIQTTQDSNHNRKFDEGDETIPYVYDMVSQQPARRIFSPAFMQQLSGRFQQQWPQKP